MTLGSLLESRAAQLPDKPYLRFEDHVVTYAQLNRGANQVAGRLQAMGVGKGDFVGLFMDNCVEFLYIYWAVARIGAVMVPMNTGYKLDELQYAINHSGQRVLFTQERHRMVVEGARSLCPGLQQIIYVDDATAGLSGRLEGPAAAVQIPEIAPTDLLAIMYTSGTTSRPKGVMLHHRSFVLAADFFIHSFDCTEADVLHGFFPLFHANVGVYMVVGAALRGCTLSLRRGFSAREHWDTVRKHGATQVSSAGSILAILNAQPLSPADRDHSVRVFVNGQNVGSIKEAPFGRGKTRSTSCRSVAQDPQSLPEVELINLATGARERLPHFSDALGAYEIPPAQVVSWEGARGERVEGLLTRPSGPAPHPLVVLIHGGPHYRSQLGILIGQSMRARVLASHGYAVLQPNFHGSSAYGNDFALSLYRSTGEIDCEDVLTGVDALIAAGIADPERLGVMGGSYGGFLTNWIIGRTDRFKAAVSQFGMWSLTGDYGNTYEDLWTIDYTGSYPWEDPAIYERLSPSSAVQNIRTPVLIMHGDEDKNVFISNSQEMWHALHHLGRTVEFVRYPRDAHGFWEPNHQIDEMDRVLRWFGRYLHNPRTPDAAVWQGHRLSVGAPQRSGPHLLVPITLHPAEPFTVQLCGAGKAEVWLDTGNRELEPDGVVAEGGATLYGEVLATFEGAANTVTVVFSVPAGAAELSLRCLGFPPVRLPAI